MAVEQGVTVLYRQQALIRSIFCRVVWLVVEEAEVLVVDRRQFRVVRRRGEGHERVLPSVVHEAGARWVVAVRVALVDVKRTDVAVAEEVVAVAEVLHALEALRVIGHHLVEDILQGRGVCIVFAFYEALGKLGVGAPVESGHVQVVFPVHQAVGVAVAAALAVVAGRAKRERGRLVGVYVDFGHEAGVLVGCVEARGDALKVVCRQEVRIVQCTVDFP